MSIKFFIENIFDQIFKIIYLGMSPLASSKNGILCDFVPPIVIISMSAARHVFIHANTIKKIRILQQENVL